MITTRKSNSLKVIVAFDRPQGRPEDFVKHFKEAGANGVTAHVEPDHDDGIENTLALIRQCS